MTGRVSILMNVIDRYDISKKYTEMTLERTGHDDWELLVCDNGSTDERVLPWIRTLPKLRYVHANEVNQGNYQMLNQLLLRCRDTYFYCVIDPDIKMPQDWLKELVRVNLAVSNSGVSGIHCVSDGGRSKVIDGVEVMWRRGAVFGTKFWNRRVMQKVGYFCEDYGPYGFGDSDFGIRCGVAGFDNYYLHGMKSSHIGHDVGDNSGYRKMKNDSLNRAKKIAGKNFRWYRQQGVYYIPAPAKTLPTKDRIWISR